jgi:hypothetical protein
MPALVQSAIAESRKVVYVAAMAANCASAAIGKEFAHETP